MARLMAGFLFSGKPRFKPQYFFAKILRSVAFDKIKHGHCAGSNPSFATSLQIFFIP